MNLSAITSFDDNFKQLNMNIIIEEAKLEPESTFENTINKVRDNHLKIIASAAMNISAITLFDENFDHIIMNNRIKEEN